ncbi:flap endonuclease-1 [Fonticula alba]|uniref:Flap endonuclease 1 n=1 Tax=Fonticula alba TaxID=691883 RepID=A0A058ZC48_FONAL|nr:flap endonuclease-1 [Fonticula alba]KCV71980.1 flap endonuclease-1 [Fonticula alba]|eukprot:XP_009493558.1 flap endonuclease-1 [Fonticula alba]
MGIRGLSQLIADVAGTAVRHMEIKHLFGRKIAIDASMSIYQFLIAVRQADGGVLTNDSGQVTSHLMGMLYRTARMVENGIKPVYVFDGKPPALKGGELSKRSERRQQAEESLKTATEQGNQADMDKFSRRTVRVTAEHTAECKRLLTLMGIPYIEAPCEAEAQCAVMAAKGLVYATASEDMDSLTCGSTILLRHLTYSEARKVPIAEYSLPRVLELLELTMDEFIDLCILLGCDFCDTIRGVGPKRALEFIRKHRNIETILENLDPKRYTVPENWPYKEVRELFRSPEVTPVADIELKWSSPDEEGIVKFLVTEKGFNEERVRSVIQRLDKARSDSTQSRLDGFFKVLPRAPADKAAANKKKPSAATTTAAKKAKSLKTGAGKR